MDTDTDTENFITLSWTKCWVTSEDQRCNVLLDDQAYDTPQGQWWMFVGDQQDGVWQGKTLITERNLQLRQIPGGILVFLVWSGPHEVTW